MGQKKKRKVYYYGAVALEDEAAFTAPIISPSSRSFLALYLGEDPPKIKNFVDAGWYRGVDDFSQLARLAISVTRQGGALLRLFGQFDDREAGCDLIMGPDMFARTSIERLKRRF